MTYPKVAIIILNYNGWKDTIECLESIYQSVYPNYEVIVVDNGSTNNSIEKIKEYCEGKIKVNSRFFKYKEENKPIEVVEFTNEEVIKFKKIVNLPSNKKLILIKNSENLGFAGGNNAGIKFALKNDCDFVLLLNNDTVVEPDKLKKFLNTWQELEKPGALSGIIYYYDSPDKIWFGGAKWEWAKIKFKINEKFPKKILKTDYICGACLFTSKEVIQKVGLFDERFFLIWEDTDWSYRARKKGYNLYILPDVKIFHKTAKSFGSYKTFSYQYYTTRNEFLFFYKHFNFFYRFFLSLYFLYEFFYLLRAKGGLTRKQILKKEKIKIETEEIKGKFYGLKDYFLKKFWKSPYQKNKK
ncbi:glycosyltransferase family 2 protein [Candidatus Pacearchaeota archaeon]|nr:MAG: glycosyltransferase family 2 protein [Candidatus Pacearchaeota archaeon]